MPDTAQTRAEKAYPIQKESPYATNYIAAAKQEGYVLGWTESQREPISDAEVEAACNMLISSLDGMVHWMVLGDDPNGAMRAALTAAAQARVSAESEKP